MGNETLAVGVDVGGTHLRAALVDRHGAIKALETREVGASRTLEPFFKYIVSLIQEVSGSHLDKIVGIGLGLPGICNQEEGVVYQLPHYPEWRDVPVIRSLKREFHCPIVIDNDANMAAVGEHWMGAAREYASFMMLTLGTGIGGGLFLKGKLWRGESGFAGEVGHMIIETDGRKCPCGNLGCWEMYAASKTVPEGRTAKGLSEAATQGDPGAIEFWKQYGEYLGVGIANLAHITDIEHYVLAGGITNAAFHFLDRCLETVRRRTYQKLGEKIIIRPSSLGGEANLLGCAASFFNVR